MMRSNFRLRGVAAALASNPNNRVAVRNYFTEGNRESYRAGDWRRLPASSIAAP